MSEGSEGRTEAAEASDDEAATELGGTAGEKIQKNSALYPDDLVQRNAKPWSSCGQARQAARPT